MDCTHNNRFVMCFHDHNDLVVTYVHVAIVSCIVNALRINTTNDGFQTTFNHTFVNHINQMGRRRTLYNTLAFSFLSFEI